MTGRDLVRIGIIVLTTLLMLGAPLALGAFLRANVPHCSVALVAYTGSGLPADEGGQHGVGIRLSIGDARVDGGRGMRVEFWRPASKGERISLAGRGGRSFAATVRRVAMVGRVAHGAASTLLRCVLGGNWESTGPEF